MGETYDIDKLSEQLGGLVAITVPENGDEDELNAALTELSRRYIKLTEKLVRGKALETKLRMSMMQMKSELDAASARVITSDDQYAACKNEGQRSAYIAVALAESTGDFKRAEIQHVSVRSVIDVIADALSCLKFLKENVSRQIQLLEIEAGLEPKEG